MVTYHNNTGHDYIAEIWVIRPTWDVSLKVALIAPVFIIGVPANISLICIIVRTKSLHTTTNLLIMNMAIADLCICTICPWLLLCRDLLQNFVLGEFGCRMDGFLVHALTMVAVFSLSIISYDQFVSIVLNCAGKLPAKKTGYALMTTWLVGMLVAGPLAYFRQFHERQWKNYLEKFCTEDFVLIYTYWNIFVGISVWLPLAIMAICYTAILIKLHYHEIEALKQKHPIIMRHKKRVAKILTLVLLSFIVCRVPFTVLVLLRTAMLQQEPMPGQAKSIYLLWYISRFLVILNAALNPLLYGYSSSPLRSEIAKCPGISWILKKKKQHTQRTCKTVSLSCDNLRPRSPCIRDKREGTGPNTATIE